MIGLGAAALLLVAPPAAGQGDTAGMLTEIKLGRGRVEVRSAAADWRPARPLMSLRAGDLVRATEDAATIVLLTGGRGSVRVDRGGSPYTVPGAPAGEGRAQKARALLDASLGFLAGAGRESGQAVLATRGISRPPVLLSPRNGPVLPEVLVVEWRGRRAGRYTVRVSGPAGVLVEGRDVTGSRWEYPADAPRLRAGTRYTVRVVAPTHAPQEAWFEVLDAARAGAVQSDLRAIEREAGPTSPGSLTVLHAGFLARQGLFHDARRAVMAGLARDPDEPALHLLLGHLYERTGLPELASQAYGEAQALTTR
jgi:hypothetical protein